MRVVEAYLAFKTVSEQSPDYQQALNGYLQAMVHHMPVLSVAQVRRIEMLTDEVSQLNQRFSAVLGPRLSS
jgi:hypothetical protein